MTKDMKKDLILTKNNIKKIEMKVLNHENEKRGLTGSQESKEKSTHANEGRGLTDSQ
jgi:hypothetical protein